MLYMVIFCQIYFSVGSMNPDLLGSTKYSLDMYIIIMPSSVTAAQLTYQWPFCFQSKSYFEKIYVDETVSVCVCVRRK